MFCEYNIPLFWQIVVGLYLFIGFILVWVNPGVAQARFEEKDVYETRLAEREENKIKHEARQQRDLIVRALEAKKNAQFDDMTIEELEAILNQSN